MHRLLWLAVALGSGSALAQFDAHVGATSFHSVKLADSVQAKVADRSFSLSPVGYGVRIKHVFVVNAKVYVAELFATDQTKFTHTVAGALSSLDGEKVVAMKLSFLRDVEESKIRASFREGLLANKVDITNADIRGFMDAVMAAGDIREGAFFAIIGEHLEGGKEAITFENSKGKASTVIGAPGFIRQIFSIWLGESADDGLTELKKSLIGEKNEKS